MKNSTLLYIKGVMKGISKRGLNVGLTNIKLSKNILTITHTGNMGNSIEHSVNPNLKLINFSTIDELRSLFSITEEKGSPDYMWHIKFDLNK